MCKDWEDDDAESQDVVIILQPLLQMSDEDGYNCKPNLNAIFINH